MENCREVLERLNAAGHVLYVVSFCGKKREQETRLALNHYLSDIIPEERWIFTRDRMLKQKHDD